MKVYSDTHATAPLKANQLVPGRVYMRAGTDPKIQANRYLCTDEKSVVILQTGKLIALACFYDDTCFFESGGYYTDEKDV